MGKQKIAIMVPNLNSGGAEKVAADLSIYFEENGYEVIIFVESRQKAKDYQHGGKVIYVNRISDITANNNKREYFLKLMRDANSYRKLKKKHKIDITISFMQTLNLLNILSRYNDKIIVTLHSVMSYRMDLANILGYGKNIFKYLYQLADKIVLVSLFCQKDWIEHYGDILSKTIVIENPINAKAELVLKNKKYFQWNFGSNVVISIARLDGVKQQWHLIRAFQKVLDKCPDAQLLIAGEGILNNALINLSLQLEINDHVHFLGFVKNVEDYLRQSKLLAVTSQTESWCNAIAEAMYQGIPIVTNDCPGGIRELIGAKEAPKPTNGNIVVDCGIITPKLDGKKYTAKEPLTKEESLFADGILLLLEDNTLREKMSEKCLENVKKYELKNIGKKWEREVIKTGDGKKGRSILKIILGFFCVFFAFLLNIYKKRENNSKRSKKEISDDKFVAYFNMLDQWMYLKENDIKIERFFKDHGYEKVAIYGMAKMANHLIKELESSTIEIAYGIDQRSKMIYSNFPVISPNEFLAIKIDAIVVTPTFDFSNIERQLHNKVSCPIISLEDIIYYCKTLKEEY